MKELSNDYEVTVTNMVPLTKADEANGFKLSTSDFFNIEEDTMNCMDILQKDNLQIFKMKDGKFIIEIEDQENFECSYFYSNSLTELTAQ